MLASCPTDKCRKHLPNTLRLNQCFTLPELNLLWIMHLNWSLPVLSTTEYHSLCSISASDTQAHNVKPWWHNCTNNAPIMLSPSEIIRCNGANENTSNFRMRERNFSRNILLVLKNISGPENHFSLWDSSKALYKEPDTRTNLSVSDFIKRPYGLDPHHFLINWLDDILFIHSFFLRIYIVPLQETYSGALPDTTKKTWVTYKTQLDWWGVMNWAWIGPAVFCGISSRAAKFGFLPQNFAAEFRHGIRLFLRNSSFSRGIWRFFIRTIFLHRKWP